MISFRAFAKYAASTHIFVLDVPELTLAPGYATALVGKSGSGKTTLINAISGLTGTISFATVPPTTAAVFHSPSLFPWATLAQTMEYEAQARGRAPDLAILGSALARFRLAPSILDQRPWEISQGMRQRFEIAKAFSFAPDLVLLDEAFSGIDVSTKADVFAFIDDQVRGSKMSVLFVTHDLGDVIRLSDVVLLIDSGKISRRHVPGIARSERLAMPGGTLIELGIAKELAADLF